jgi:hypothetical protein
VEIGKFDAALAAQILHTLKQAAIEEGQWTEKRDGPSRLSTLLTGQYQANKANKRQIDSEHLYPDPHLLAG